MMKKLLCLWFLATLTANGYAQELNARVQVLAPNVTNLNTRNLEVIQKAARDLLNNTKWTTENYQQQERIECSFIITINSFDGNSAYVAEAQIQSARPVYNSSYNTTMLSMSDKNFDFNYTEGQALDFSEQNFLSKLSSLLGFYAYTIIGLDKDTFSKMGGTPLYQKAQNILNIAHGPGGLGWKPADGMRSRYWLNENLLNASFKPLRSFIYNYHFNGLDKMQQSRDEAIKRIVFSLTELEQMGKQKAGSIFPNVYFSAKAPEIVNIFALSSNPQDKIKIYNRLAEIDPANIGKYEALKK